MFAVKVSVWCGIDVNCQYDWHDYCSMLQDKLKILFWNVIAWNYVNKEIQLGANVIHVQTVYQVHYSNGHLFILLINVVTSYFI